MSGGPCALRHVENRQAAHGARARLRSWRGCLYSQRGALSIPRCWPRLHFNGFMPCGGSGFASLWTWFPSPIPRGPRALRPVENRPTVNGARARWRTLRGCLCSQRRARSTPHRVPRILITDTAPGRWLRLQNNASKASEAHAARPTHASPCGEPAGRPRSTSALAELAWLSLQPTRSALHHTLLAEAPLQRILSRLGASASVFRDHGFRIPCQAARVRFAL